MPFGDGTGPMGAGPMTGRAAGYCAGYGVPGRVNPGFGRGWGCRFWGRGGGHGWRHWYCASGLAGWARRGGGVVPPASGVAAPREKQWLENQAQALQTRLDEIRRRLSELEAEKK